MEENKLKTVEQPRDRVVLVGLSSPVLKADSADEESMDELAALVETAGAVSVATVLQNLPSPNPRSFIGEGKVAEIKELIGSTEATMAIFDNDLSPSQMRVLTEDLGVQVLDRSGLILDIFAQRAKTKEGRLQVELAQYQYLLPRLIGMWTHLERQAGTSGKGPIGSKGPGETQLETDRRHIHRKIDKLKEDLDEVRRVRGTQRERRMKNEIPVVAIVGYTNAGKSTLLNRLLNEERAMVSEIAGTTRDVIEECANIGGVLFRFLVTAGIRPTDDRLEQMGIQRTMSSIERARIVIHMVDASTLTGPVPAPDFPLRPGQKLLTVVNKTDKAPAAWRLPEGVVGISAKHGEGIDALCDALRESVDTEALYHGDPVVSNSRHYEALSAAREALGQALDGLAHGLPPDLLSEEIRQVITHLGAITGRVAIAPDEILQNIFSKFCIGK